MFGLSAVATEAIAAAVVALLIFLGGMKAGHDLEADKYDKLVASYATATAQAAADAAAKQSGIDQVALKAAADQAQAQSDRATQLAQELANANAHISVKTITATCVPYGFLRVLYAGGHGVTTDSLALPTGKSDAACSPLGWAGVASAILHDYNNALANSTQLNLLIGAIKQDQSIMKGK